MEANAANGGASAPSAGPGAASSCMDALRGWPAGVSAICSGLELQVSETAVAAAAGLG